MSSTLDRSALGKVADPKIPRAAAADPCIRGSWPEFSVPKSVFPSSPVSTVVAVIPKFFVSEDGGALGASGCLDTRGWSVGFRIGSVDTRRKESRRILSP